VFFLSLPKRIIPSGVLDGVGRTNHGATPVAVWTVCSTVPISFVTNTPLTHVESKTLRTREYVERGEQEGKTVLEAMRDGDTEGIQHFDGEIEKLIRAGTIDLETGLGYATNPRKPRA